MKNILLNEIILSVVLVILAILFLDPFMFVMPDSVVYLLIAAILLVFILFASFVWRETASDERDEMHKLLAGRIGYLFGTGILVVGVIVQTLTTHPDPWLVAGLSVMVIGKLIGRWYARAHF